MKCKCGHLEEDHIWEEKTTWTGCEKCACPEFERLLRNEPQR